MTQSIEIDVPDRIGIQLKALRKPDLLDLDYWGIRLCHTLR